MRRFLRDNGLSLVMAGLFVVLLVGQSVAGWRQYNENQREHRRPAVDFVGYLGNGHFTEAVFENWESEFLQMAGYVWLTSLLFQRGSAESKDPDEPPDPADDPERHRDDPDAPWPVRRGGLALALYSHSLSIAFLTLFVLSFVGHAVGGLEEYNEERREHGQPTDSLAGYLASPTFWFESLQNWQSEFLAVAAMVVLSIWLREANSPESKPVVRPHSATGSQ
ncbi:MAG TPA: DUF6766 family protein [Planctomycetaceae bacterium]